MVSARRRNPSIPSLPPTTAARSQLGLLEIDPSCGVALCDATVPAGPSLRSWIEVSTAGVAAEGFTEKRLFRPDERFNLRANRPHRMTCREFFSAIRVSTGAMRWR